MLHVWSSYKVCHRQFAINSSVSRISNDWWIFYQLEQIQCLPVIMPRHSLSFQYASLDRKRRGGLTATSQDCHNPEPTRTPMGRCHELCMWMPPITCHMAFEGDWQGSLVHGQPSSRWRCGPWNNLIQMWTAANILWSICKPMKNVLNRVQNEWPICYACLLIQKALFHHNVFIVEEEEGGMK